MSSAANIDFDYNLIYRVDAGIAIEWIGKNYTNATFPSFVSIEGQEANSPGAVDPLFTDIVTNDFTLQSGSKTIDAGINAGLLQDHDGTAVPQGFEVDLGAHEFIKIKPPQNVRIVVH